MKKIKKIADASELVLRSFALFLFVMLIFAFAIPAYARKKSDNSAPCLTAIYLEQGGDSQVFLNLEGRKLPRPVQISSDDEKIILLLPEVKFPAIAYERDGDVPLISAFRAEQSDAGTVLTLFCERNLQQGKVSGVSTSHLTMRFSAASEPSSRRRVMTAARDERVFKPRLVTLNMKDCDLADVFRMLGALGDVNILVDGSVSQKIRLTLSFTDAPIEDVFRYVLRSQNLESSRMGRTIVVGAAGSMAVLGGKLFTQSYEISYADPQKIEPLLRDMAELNSPANRTMVDERQNLIIVKATQRQQEQVRQALQILDAPQRQVMLKARIVEVNEDADDELEGAINAVYNEWWLSSQGGETSTGYARSRQHSDAETGLANLDSTNTLPGTIGSGVIDLAGTATHMLDVRLRSLVEENKARIIADPTVTVIDGGKATVKLIEKLKYISNRDDANNPTYDDEEVGPSLQVSPRIGRNGVITVAVSLETGEVVQWISGGQGEQVPQTNSRSVSTVVNVRDGEPFVIGGLYKNTKTRTRTGIPVLRDLPLLGLLFKSHTYRSTRSQVVMVIVPSILETPDRF